MNIHSYSVDIIDKGSWPQKWAATFIIYTDNINRVFFCCGIMCRIIMSPSLNLLCLREHFIDHVPEVERS